MCNSLAMLPPASMHLTCAQILRGQHLLANCMRQSTSLVLNDLVQARCLQQDTYCVFVCQLALRSPLLQVKKNLITLMGNVHGCMRQGCQEYFERYRRNVFVTPKSFLSFIQGYKGMYENKLKHTRGLASSIAAGLQKMNDAKVDVNRMKVRACLMCLH